MAPEVFYSVCYGITNPAKEIQAMYTFTPAVLHDHCRHRVKGQDYPAVVPEDGKSVLGVFATGLTDANVAKLDEFEGSEYEKLTRKVSLVGAEGKAGEIRNAPVYIYLNHNQMEREEWDFEHFRSSKMHAWTRNEWSFQECKLTLPITVGLVLTLITHRP